VSTDTVRIEPATTRAQASRRSRSASLGDTLRFPLLVWVAHFLLTQIPASLAYRFGEFRSVEYNGDWTALEPANGPDSSAYQIIRAPLDGLAHWLVEPFRNWDGTWYAMVAENSYSPDGPASAAFFPLYPWLMDLGSRLTGLSVETVGYIVSHLAFAGGLIVLYMLIRMDFNDSIARATIVALAVFPTAFFFSAIYTESLFLFLSVTCLWGARKNDWLLAAIMGFLAALTRSAGIMLLAPLAVLFIQQHGWDLRRWFPKALLGVLPVLGLVVFGWFLTTKDLGFQDWREQQWQWNRFTATPWRTFECAFNGCTEEVRGFGSTYTAQVHPVSFDWIGDLFRNLNWTYITSTEFRYVAAQSQVLDVLVTIAAFVLILIGLKKVPFYYTAWVIPPMIVPLLAPSSVFPLMSMPRFVLPLFPLFVVAVLLIRNRRAGIVLAAISAVLLVLLTMQFALWYWVA
jgi:hypothetical protein